MYIKNMKNKMKKSLKERKKKDFTSKKVPTHNEAVDNAVKLAKIYLKGYI